MTEADLNNKGAKARRRGLFVFTGGRGGSRGRRDFLGQARFVYFVLFCSKSVSVPIHEICGQLPCLDLIHFRVFLCLFVAIPHPCPFV